MKSVQWWRFAVCALVFCAASPVAAQGGFPYDSELILDVAPMRGSKKIPNMDVARDGKIALEMWCNRIEGRVVVAANTITVMTDGQVSARSCPPERARGDDELLAALNDVTTWRREGSIVLLIGSKTLRFRLPTN